MDDRNIKDNPSNNAQKQGDFGNGETSVHRSGYTKKAEKIAAALFLVSNFLSDNEPLKWDIRRAASGMVGLISRADKADTSRKDGFTADIRALLTELSSLMEVAALSGLISGMNSEILMKELASLFSALERRGEKNHRMDYVKIPKDFFIKEEQILLSEPSVPARENSHSNIKDKKGMSYITQSIEADELTIQKDKKKEYGSVAMKRNRRQTFIIQILKKKKELTIKDISTIFHDCSEKTIQRELIALIKEGVVTRDGARRWTKYSLSLLAQ